eukprot:1620043-Amphidinium_carterae.1
MRAGHQQRTAEQDEVTEACSPDMSSRGESLLLHGTNPSIAMSILKSGFVLGNVGKAVRYMWRTRSIPM